MWLPTSCIVQLLGLLLLKDSSGVDGIIFISVGKAGAGSGELPIRSSGGRTRVDDLYGVSLNSPSDSSMLTMFSKHAPLKRASSGDSRRWREIQLFSTLSRLKLRSQLCSFGVFFAVSERYCGHCQTVQKQNVSNSCCKVPLLAEATFCYVFSFFFLRSSDFKQNYGQSLRGKGTQWFIDLENNFHFIVLHILSFSPFWLFFPLDITLSIFMFNYCELFEDGWRNEQWQDPCVLFFQRSSSVLAALLLYRKKMIELTVLCAMRHLLWYLFGPRNKTCQLQTSMHELLESLISV